jgi:membrane protease YdiL (CAAX protease family)
VDFLKILPLAFVMIAGPQILSAIFLATSEHWQRNSAAFILGAALSITIFVTAAYLIGGGGREGGPSGDTVYVIILVLLVAAAIHAYVKREESEPPKWMGRLQTASPRFSFTLGFLLLGIFPTDILTSVAVGGYLAAHNDAWADAIPFILLTLLFLALPSLLLLIFRERGKRFLPKARDWMNTNSWIVNEVVIVFFILITIDSLAG